MPKNKKQDANTIAALPNGVAGTIMIVCGLVLLVSAVTYTPADLPLTPMKFLKEFSPGTEPTLPRRNFFGPFGAFLGFIQLQMFGASAFILPLGLLVLGGGRLFKKKRETILMRIGLGGLLVCLAGFFGSQNLFLADWAEAVFLTGAGGIVGQLTGEFLLVNLIAVTGSVIVFLTGYIIFLSLFFGIHPIEFFYGCWDLAVEGSLNFKKWLAGHQYKKSDRRKRVVTPVSTSLPTSTGSLFADEEVSKPRKRKAKTSENVLAGQSAVELEPTSMEANEAPVIIDGTAKKILTEEALAVKPFEKKTEQYAGLSSDGFEGYELPGFDLLDYDSSSPAVETNRDKLFETQKLIIDTLKSFGLDVTPGDITRGPTITRFEVYPSVGLKVSRISSLEADLARVTKAEAINILAPAKG